MSQLREKVEAILLEMYQAHKTNYEKWICWLPDEALDKAKSALITLLKEEVVPHEQNSLNTELSGIDESFAWNAARQFTLDRIEEMGK